MISSLITALKEILELIPLIGKLLRKRASGGEFRRTLLLAVDDEASFVRIIRRIAEGLAIEVRGLSEPERFASVMSEVRPDIVVIDLKMAGSDGVELLHEMRSLRSRAKVLIISGFDASMVQHAHEIGTKLGLDMRGYLIKPIRTTEMRDMLRSCLDENIAGNRTL